MKKAYYNRIMSEDLENLLKEGGEFHWLIDYVKKEEHKDLDFQTGSNLKIDNKKDEITNKLSKSWFSIYKGTGRIITMEEDGIPYKIKRRENKKDETTYEKIKLLELSEKKLDDIKLEWDKDTKKDRYYIDKKGKKKEGYYQTLISRRYSLKYKKHDPLVIFDKEFKIGCRNESIRDNEFMPSIKNWVCDRKNDIYKAFTDDESFKPCKAINQVYPKEFNKISTECDFVGINEKGDIVLLELKRHEDGSKIYLSPLQVGTYYKLLSKYIEWEGIDALQNVVFEMIKQKQRLGIINNDYVLPQKLSGKIKLAIVVGGEASQQAIDRYKKVKDIIEADIAGDIVDNKIFYYSCGEKGSIQEELL